MIKRMICFLLGHDLNKEKTYIKVNYNVETASGIFPIIVGKKQYCYRCHGYISII